MPITKSKETEWKGFINVNLSREQKEQLESWDIHDSEMYDELARVIESGYKLSLVYSTQTGTFTATFTGGSEAGKNSGYAVTAYARDLYNAYRCLLYKVSIILPENWKEFKPAAIDDIG